MAILLGGLLGPYLITRGYASAEAADIGTGPTFFHVDVTPISGVSYIDVSPIDDTETTELIFIDVEPI